MTYTWDQAPGLYLPFESTDVLLVGPHNRFTRNGILLNDRSQLECFWVDDLSGFDFSDVTVSATPNVQETGEAPDPGSHGGRTMTLTGWIQAGNYPTMMRMGRALMDSLVDLDERPMQIITADGGMFIQPDVYIDCRLGDKPQLATQVQAGDLSGVIKRNFTIALRASDPTYKATVEKTAELTPITTALPGRPYDRVYDITYTELLDFTGSISDAGPNVYTVTNNGNWNASLRIRVTGSAQGVVVVNETTGQAMYFSDVLDDEYIEVDTHPRRGSVHNQDGELRNELLDSRSDWMWLQGIRNGTDGTNRIVIYVDSFGSEAKVDLWWHDTWI